MYRYGECPFFSTFCYHLTWAERQPETRKCHLERTEKAIFSVWKSQKDTKIQSSSPCFLPLPFSPIFFPFFSSLLFCPSPQIIPQWHRHRAGTLNTEGGKFTLWPKEVWFKKQGTNLLCFLFLSVLTLLGSRFSISCRGGKIEKRKPGFLIRGP